MNQNFSQFPPLLKSYLLKRYIKIHYIRIVWHPPENNILLSIKFVCHNTLENITKYFITNQLKTFKDTKMFYCKQDVGCQNKTYVDVSVFTFMLLKVMKLQNVFNLLLPFM